MSSFTQPSQINWGELQRKAVKSYEKEGARRRKLGSKATEDAERLAYNAKKKGLPDVQTADEAADQSVWAYNGKILLDHYPPSTIWDTVLRPNGMACEVRCFSPSRGNFVLTKTYEPGEWTWVGRSHPDDPS